MKKLFIDDERSLSYLYTKYPELFSPESLLDFDIVRSADEAIEYIKKNGMPNFISFDHDLGDNKDAPHIVNFIIDEVLDGNLTIPDNFDFHVHSSNPIGAIWIITKLTSFLVQHGPKNWS